MKTPIFAFFVFAVIVVSQTSRSANLFFPQEEAPAAVNMFYADLAPYGEWIELDPGVYAWHPSIVDLMWRPYTRGHWVWSEYGWFWISAEPFGWATYHYGRWYMDNSYGWIWIPDTIWGPAWVEWRCNDEYIGWAPLPPYARFHVTVGIRFTKRWNAPPAYWSFVSYNQFASDRPYHSYIPESNARRFISTTRRTGRYQIDQNRVVNQGVERSFIEHRTSNRIESASITETRDRGVERITRNGTQDRVEVYKPKPEEFTTVRAHIQARKATTKTSLDIDRIEQFRAAPRRGTQASQGASSLSRRGPGTTGREVQQPQRSGKELSPPNNASSRRLRQKPQFPAPRFDRMTPHRSGDSKDKDRPGRRRDRF